MGTKSVFESLYVTLVVRKGRKEIFEVLAFSLLIRLCSFHIVMFSLSSDFETTPKISLVAQIPATTIFFFFVALLKQSFLFKTNAIKFKMA